MEYELQRFREARSMTTMERNKSPYEGICQNPRQSYAIQSPWEGTKGWRGANLEIQKWSKVADT